LGICWLRSPAQKKRSSASDALTVFRLSLAARKRRSCLHHRNICVVPELKPENLAPLPDANSAFTEADVRCKGAAVIAGRRKTIGGDGKGFPSGGGPEHWVISLREFVSLLMMRLHQSDCVPI